MESIYLLIPISIVLVFIIAALFWWSVRSGQFDDLEGPAHRVMMDSDASKRRNPQQKDAKKVFEAKIPD
jgi:cbb3-type cytochrome oxidase maturation protein